MPRNATTNCSNAAGSACWKGVSRRPRRTCRSCSTRPRCAAAASWRRCRARARRITWASTSAGTACWNPPANRQARMPGCRKPPPRYRPTCCWTRGAPSRRWTCWSRCRTAARAICTPCACCCAPRRPCSITSACSCWRAACCGAMPSARPRPSS
ncbi:Uncharacterised protein [Bordetella pertussis]|nr:Uncharacterised protein [Bordetella pertussis]